MSLRGVSDEATQDFGKTPNVAEFAKIRDFGYNQSDSHKKVRLVEYAKTINYMSGGVAFITS